MLLVDHQVRQATNWTSHCIYTSGRFLIPLHCPLTGVAKPLAELKDVKDAPKTKELKLAGKGIIVLSGFEPFVGLEVGIHHRLA